MIRFSTDWHAWGLQVTNTSDHTMELRALMTVSNSPKACPKCAWR
jgi:hypothetical protein